MVNIMRVRASSTGWNGAPGVNTFYFQSTTPATDTSAQLAATRVRAAMFAQAGARATVWQCQVSPQVDVLDAVTGTVLNTLDGGAQAVVNGAANNANWGPIASALCLTIQTNAFLGGRNLKGRAFMSPISSESCEANGSPNAAAIAYIQSAGTALLAQGATDVSLVVWRRPRKANAAHVPPITARAGDTGTAISTSVKDVYAVLRSRR